MTDFTDLIARVEGATGPDRQLDVDLWFALAWEGRGDERIAPPLTASLDAALALVERVRPDAHCLIERTDDGHGWAMVQSDPIIRRLMTGGATPALALILALLRSLSSSLPEERMGSSGASVQAAPGGATEGQSCAGGRRWWWLSELGPYGYGKPIDGPHETREGAEQALYLFQRLGLARDRKFACAEITETPIEPHPHGANEGAIITLNSIGLRPPAESGAGSPSEASAGNLPPDEPIPSSSLPEGT